MNHILTQRNQILSALLAKETVTALTAFQKFKCLRLSGRIYELKADGYDVQKTFVKTKSGKVVASYFLNHELATERVK